MARCVVEREGSETVGTSEASYSFPVTILGETLEIAGTEKWEEDWMFPKEDIQRKGKELYDF